MADPAYGAGYPEEAMPVRRCEDSQVERHNAGAPAAHVIGSLAVRPGGPASERPEVETVVRPDFPEPDCAAPAPRNGHVAAAPRRIRPPGSYNPLQVRRGAGRVPAARKDRS